MSFYDRDQETASRDRVAEVQSEKLLRLLDDLSGSPFYREKLKHSGIDLQSIAGIHDLARLPFTEKAELVESQQRHPPYGQIATAPRSRYRYVHQTSGTSGSPLLWLDSQEDWATWVRCWGQVFRGAGVTEEDVVFCAFSFGPFIAHWTSLAGARALGALAVPGSGMSSLQRLQAIDQHAATVVVSTPTYALHLAEVAEEHGLDLAEGSVRTTIHAGEPGASVANVKSRIEQLWGARTFDHAGATEVGAWGFDCQADDLAIHLNELEFAFEVVDPESGEAVDNGTRGELVITTLGRNGMPVLRYRTRDLVVRNDEPCACGRNLARIEGGVLGRADDMLTVRGVNVYPSAIDNLVRGIPAIVEYEVEVRRRQQLDDLLIKVETAPGRATEETTHTLREVVQSQLGIRIEAASVDSGSLPRYELKANRFKRVED